MSTSKHIDKICIAAIAVTLAITLLFMSLSNSSSFWMSTSSMGYEDTLFDTEKVHSVDIVMDDWDSFIESCENEEYASCTVVIDGEKYSNIAIRAKGNTSLSNVKSMNSERYSFKLEFDHYVEGNSYHGLDKLCLNNLIQDNTMMKDYLAYTMMNDFGVTSPLCSYVFITVNGEDWGLYLAVESIEDSFLERNYGSDTGELYKPDSMSFGGGKGNGKGFNMDDFNFDSEASGGDEQSGNFPMPGGGPGDFKMPEGGPSGDFKMPEGGPSGDFKMSEGGPGNFTMPEGEIPDDRQTANGPKHGDFSMGSDDVKLKYTDDSLDSYSNIFDNAKTTVTDTDKKRLIASLKNLSEYSDIENTVDTDEVLRYFVVHNFLCNGDSYTGNMIHNYYLHEDDGMLSMIPWDYNLAFGTFQAGDATNTINVSIDDPLDGEDVNSRPMVGWIFSDDEYTLKYHELFNEFVQKWYTNGELEQLIEKTADMIRPYVEKDPTKFCTTEELETGVSAISQFVNLRLQAVSNQLNGDDTTVDASELNLSDMGSMNTGGGPGGINNGGPGDMNNGNFGGPGGMKPDEDFDSGNNPPESSETVE